MEIQANRLKDLREDHDLSQKELAAKLGYHTTTYQRWEESVHSIKLIDAINIADFFGVSLDYLAGRTNCKEIRK
ncbi:MAG: helix-turn-helix transcriptional regulator [Oscillospiraceae bacterium]